MGKEVHWVECTSTSISEALRLQKFSEEEVILAPILPFSKVTHRTRLNIENGYNRRV